MARYVSIAVQGPNGPYYPIVDTATGRWVRVENCPYWADKRAKEYESGKRKDLSGGCAERTDSFSHKE